MSDTGVAATARRYSKAQRDQAVRLVRQLREETGEKHGAVQRVAHQLGFGVETVRKWVNQADVDDGSREGLSSAECRELSELRRENRRLREDVEILERATAFFAKETR